MNIEAIATELSCSNLIGYLSRSFKGDILEKLAKDCKFIERSSSRLTGKMFLELNLCDFGDNGSMSLTEKCEYLYEHYGIEMSKQSLDERYNTYAVKFMRTCFEEIFSCFMSDFEGLQGLSSRFKAVFLSDATSFQLPCSLASFYLSNGGDTSGSSIKIHQSYELLKGQIVDFYLTDGKEADVNYWQKGNLSIVAQALYLADLGYHQLAHFEQLSHAGAYWLSRYKTNTNLYFKDKQGHLQVWDLMDILPTIEKHLVVEELYVGKKHQLPARLIIECLPDAIKVQRLKKLKAQTANQSKQRKAYQNTELKKLLCGFNVFITNTSTQQLTSTQILSFYSLRWQIELLFKIWKSLLAINKIGKMSIFRFECYLYGKLIALLLSNQIKAFVQKSDEENQLELSEWKVTNYFKKK